MLEVVATTPSRPLGVCVVLRLDMMTRSRFLVVSVVAAREDSRRAVATHFYTPKLLNFPICPITAVTPLSSPAYIVTASFPPAVVPDFDAREGTFVRKNPLCPTGLRGYNRKACATSLSSSRSWFWQLLAGLPM